MASASDARSHCQDPHLPESLRALPGPEGRAGDPEPAPPCTRRGERTTAAAVERTAPPGEDPAACLRLPRGERRTDPTAHTGTAFPSFLRVSSKLPVPRALPHKTTLPRRLRVRARFGRPARKPQHATACALCGGAAPLERAHQVSRGQWDRPLHACF